MQAAGEGGGGGGGRGHGGVAARAVGGRGKGIQAASARTVERSHWSPDTLGGSHWPRAAARGWQRTDCVGPPLKDLRKIIVMKMDILSDLESHVDPMDCDVGS